MNAAEFYQIWCRSEDFWKIRTGGNVWLHFAEAFAAFETAAKEAAIADYEKLRKLAHELEADVEAAEAERDRAARLLSRVQEWTAKFPVKSPASAPDKAIADDIYLEVTNLLNTPPPVPVPAPKGETR